MGPARIARVVVSALLLSFLVSCQSESVDLETCELVDGVFDAFFQEAELGTYVGLTEDLAIAAERGDDQLLSDVGLSLRIIALQWSESDFTDSDMAELNATGVRLLNERCGELRR